MSEETTPPPDNAYEAENVNVLKDAAHIRKRPGNYTGSARCRKSNSDW